MIETRISLSEEELGIIVELLRQEQRQLPVEMHHTRSSEYRTELLSRQAVVSGLLHRLEKELDAAA